MGKDFTSAKGDDNVFTPYSMTEQLLENEYFDFNKKFLEPACGTGAIVKILNKNTDNIVYRDIEIELNNRPMVDFLNSTYCEKFDYIITNPPYSKLDQFIKKAKQIVTDKFAFLCKITHLGGEQRFNSNIFKEPTYPLTKIYMFTRQANLRFNTKYNPDYIKLREDGKYPAGMYYYCWLVWERINFENLLCLAPTFHWISNDKYILRNSDK